MSANVDAERADETLTWYTTWDFERNQAIAYERQGECRQCGACCLGSIRVVGRFPLRGNVEHSGVWYEIPPDDQSRRHYRIRAIEHDGSRCSCLTDEKLCNSRDNGKYVPICQDWPVSPDHLLIYPDCGYSFVEVERWELSQTVIELN